MKKPTDFAYHLTNFLGKYLPGQQGFSVNTIKSYRDSFSLFLKFCQEELGISPENITIESITSEMILNYLTWIEKTRNCSVATRNQRLAAFHSFFNYLQIECPQYMLLCQKIMAINFKKSPKKSVNFLSLQAIETILALPNHETPSGLRDLTLLSLLYDTGARVQEIVDLTVSSVRIEEPATVTLTGKGAKSRVVPITKQTREILQNYLIRNNLLEPYKMAHPLFCNRSNQKLTRAGITYILNKYVKEASETSSDFALAGVSPHKLRHSKAMHMLQSGINLIYIRDLLGHVDIKTTEVYARADSEMKRKALEKVHVPSVPDTASSWHNNSELLDWLKNL